MNKAKFGVPKQDTNFGRDFIASAQEALAHKRGEIELPVRVIEPVTPAGVKALREQAPKE